MEEKIDCLREIFPLTSREILLQSLNNNNGVICSETLDEIILRESVLEDEEENFDSRNTNKREEKMIEELSYQFPSLTKEDIWIFLEVSNIENWVDKEVIELVPMIREQHLLQIEKFKKPKRTQINNPIVSINRSFINNSINSIKDLLPILLTSLNKEWSLNNASNRLHDFISTGSNILSQLRDQKNTFKQTQRQLLDATGSLGIGKSILKSIGRKSGGDKIIFYLLIAITALFIFPCK